MIRLKIEHLLLSDVINLPVETVRPALDAAGHRFELVLPTVPIYLRADAVRLMQAMVNLMNNAIKYTEPPGEVRLSVTAGSQYIVLRVKDSGVGIPEELLTYIFDQLWRNSN